MLSLEIIESCYLRIEALYIISVGWVIILTLGVVLVTLILSPPTGYASNPHGASVDASCVTKMS